MHRPWSCEAESCVVLRRKNEVVSLADGLRCCKSGGFCYIFQVKIGLTFRFSYRFIRHTHHFPQVGYLKEIPFIIRRSVKTKHCFPMCCVCLHMRCVVAPPVMKRKEQHFPLSFKAVVLKFWQKRYLLLTIGVGRNGRFV